MAKITTISEPWDRHDYPEVEEFVKAKLKEYKDEAEELAYTKHPELMPLTFEAAENGVKIFFNCDYGEEATRTVEVSTDDGATWRSFTSENYDEEENTPIATLNAGEKALVRGDNEAMGYLSIINDDDLSAGSFRIVGRCYVYGNVMSLLDSQNFRTKADVAGYAFFSLFGNYFSGKWSNTDLLFHPTKHLVLPATTLADYCYASMFNGCTGLTTAPELPATTLANYCYASMFYGCTGLTTAPELPATTLASNCYGFMFYGCTSLTTAPELPATTLAASCYNSMFENTSLVNAPALPVTTLVDGCYRNMFSNCTSLVSAPVLPATTLATYCYKSMFEGCTSLVNAPALPATTLANNCYSEMFKGCVALVNAPALPATTLVTYCYKSMFYGCINLSYIKAMFAPMNTSYLTNWVNGVSATGTFVKNPSLTMIMYGNSGVPNNWDIEDAS